MANKADLAHTLNELLGDQVDWTKLSKEELENLVNAFENRKAVILANFNRLNDTEKTEVLESLGAAKQSTETQSTDAPVTPGTRTGGLLDSLRNRPILGPLLRGDFQL